MKTRWMLLAVAVIVSCPLVADAQYPSTPWSYIAYYEDSDGSTDPSWPDSGKSIYNPPPATESGYNSCVPPGYRVRDPWGNLLEPGIVAVSEPYDCTETVRETGVTGTTSVVTSIDRKIAQIEDQIRILQKDVEELKRTKADNQ